jgi:alpha-beta hydrolase superfamily lysophospholipase
MTVHSQEHSVAAADGTPLFVTDWRPESTDSTDSANSPNGGVILMHGLGEHSGRYQHVAQFFNAMGMSVRAYDHRGHGRSGGPRGDVPDSNVLLDDAQLVVDDFARQFSIAPILFGHSMGGLIAARYAVERRSPLRALILSSPALAIALSGGQKLLLKVLGAIAPGLTLPNGLEQRYLSHDANVVELYGKDPLVHGKISARLLNCMLASMAIAQAQAASLAVPTLLLYAGDDRIVDASGSEMFGKSLPANSSESHVYPALYHEIFNEIGAEQVFGDMRNWLARL